MELGSANLQATPVTSQQNYSVEVAIASGEWDVLSHLFLSAGCDITFAPLKTEFRELSMNQSSKIPDVTKQVRRNTLAKFRNISYHCIFVRNKSTQWTGRQQGDSSAVWPSSQCCNFIKKIQKWFRTCHMQESLSSVKKAKRDRRRSRQIDQGV